MNREENKSYRGKLVVEDLQDLNTMTDVQRKEFDRSLNEELSKTPISKATLSWIERWTSQIWEPIVTDIDFSQHTPISTSSLHIHEDRYEIGGRTYRLLYPISDSGAEPLIEILNLETRL